MESSHKWQEYSCLHSLIIKKLYAQGFQNPTLIQSQVYENYKHYFDFLIASQTGSGKTLSFAAPIVSDLISISQKTQLPPKPLCLVLIPTRELALQIQQVFTFLLSQTQINKICILGGMSMAKQVRILQQQTPHIIIGTPGRIHELLNQNQLSFELLKFLVIDQADRMIEMGHYRELDQILNKIFVPRVKQFFENDFQQINQKMDQAQQKSQYYVYENGKKKKIKFNLNSIKTQTLFQIPMDIFQIQGQIPVLNIIGQNKKKLKKKKRDQSENPEQQNIQQQQNNLLTEQQTLQMIQKMKRRIFFISATLTRQFKGTKYFTKKNKPLQQTDKKSKSKDKTKDKRDKQQQNQYIPKLKALLSRVKFDAKPKIIDQSSHIFLPAKLKQKYCFCQSDIDKITIILCYINQLPQNSKVIIFTNTIRASKRLKFFIQSAGLRAVTLHSHMIQKQRLQKLQRFQKSKSNILISTDVAARGLDFIITSVIQFSVPINGDTYVHRVGRTARANRPGQALVLISEKQATRWQEISQTLQSSDANRKPQKYCPIHSSYELTKQRVQQYEWIRLNQQKQQNKRIQKLNQIQAQQFGFQAQELITKPKRVSDQQEREHRQRIEKHIKSLKDKNKNINTLQQKKVQMPQVGDGKIWKKNKLVMSLDEIKKFL